MYKLKSLLATLIVSALLPVTTPSWAAEKLDISASFSVIGDFAEQLGGDRINLRTLVGQNGDAHVYDPKPSDTIAMAKADFILVPARSQWRASLSTSSRSAEPESSQP